MTKLKPLQTYLSEEERKQLEQIKESLEQKTLSSTIKQLIKIFFTLKR